MISIVNTLKYITYLVVSFLFRMFASIMSFLLGFLLFFYMSCTIWTPFCIFFLKFTIKEFRVLLIRITDFFEVHIKLNLFRFLQVTCVRIFIKIHIFQILLYSSESLWRFRISRRFNHLDIQNGSFFNFPSINGFIILQSYSSNN